MEKDMKKRIISIFLCLLLLTTIVPFGAMAEPAGVPALQNLVWNGDDGLSFSNVSGAYYYVLELRDSTRCWAEYSYYKGSSGVTVSGSTVSFSSAEMKQMHRAVSKDSDCYMQVTVLDSSRNEIASGKTSTRHITAYPTMTAPQNAKWSGIYATWNAVEGADTYTIWLYEVDSNGYIISPHVYTQQTYSTKLSLSSYLEAGKTYRFMVQTDTTDDVHRNSYSTASNDVTTIDKIEAIGLTAPEIGTVATENIKSIKAPAGANYTLSSASWLDKSNGSAQLASGEKFEADHEYILRVYATPKSGYIFLSTGKTSGTVDGNAANVGGVYGSDSQYAMRYEYGKAGKLNISSVDVSGYIVPVAGAKAGDYMNITVSENCHLDMSKCYWYCRTTGKTMAANDVFEAGKQYALFIYACADTNCRFNGSTKVTINGSTEYVDAEHIGLGDIVIPFWSKPVTVAAAIKSVSVGGYVPAVAGEKAGDHMNLYAYGNYSIDFGSSYWYCDTTCEILSADDVFEAGKEYSLFVYIVPTGTNVFADDVYYTVNGSSENVDYGNSQSADDCIELWTASEKAKTGIQSVAITGYEAPVVGEKAGDHLNLSINGNGSMRIDTCVWYCDTTGEELAANDVFQAGNEYSLYLYLTPAEKYLFAENAAVTVNGSKMYVDSDNTDNYRFDMGVWTLPVEPLSKVSSVSITGYEAPVAGDKAGDHMNFTVSGNCSIYAGASAWYCNDTDEELAPDDVFEAGKEYYLYLALETDEGYVFADDVSCTINGSTEDFDPGNPPMVFDNNTFLGVCTVYTKLPEPLIEIDSVAITGYRPAIAGNKVSDHMSISVSGNCSIDKPNCCWYCDTTGEELASTDVFEAGKEYSLFISLIPNDGYAFAEVVYCSINGGDEYVDFDNSQSIPDCLEIWTMPMEAKSVTPTAPSAPTLSISKSNGKINLSWNAVEGANKYWVYRSTDGTNYKYYDTTTKTGYTNSSVTSGTKYYYKVKAVSTFSGKDYSSGYSNAKSTIPLSTPSLKPSLSTGKAALSWTSVTGATKYWIYRSTDGVNFKYYDSTTKTSYTNSSVTAGTTYYYKVRAVKTVNGTDWTSDYSAAADVFVLSAPAVSISKADGKISLSWTAVDGAAKYWIYRSTDGTNYKYYDSTTKTSYTNSSVTSGTKYYYKVKAVNTTDGTSAFSAAKSTIPLSTPTVSAKLNSGKVVLNWNSVTGATKYWIYRSTDGVNFKYYDSTTKTSYTNSSVTAGITYYYEVRAVKTVNGTDWTGSYSVPVSITR